MIAKKTADYGRGFELLHRCRAVLFWLVCFNALADNGKAPDSFLVKAYEVRGPAQFLGSAPGGEFLSGFVGTNVPLGQLAKAAGAMQAEFARRGVPSLSVAVSPDAISNGVVALHVFRGGSRPQIVVRGRPYTPSGDLITGPDPRGQASSSEPGKPSGATNAGPKFVVRSYDVAGNTLLSEQVLAGIFSKYVGTNVGVPEILAAASALQTEYRERSFPTVNVTVPPQQITNQLVHIQVFEGLLDKIQVVNNRHFSSNNVMRALPSLKPGILLNSRVFQAELDRANGNQDRQIYPEIEPGTEPGTTALRLKVQDRLPLHGKVELNNQSSPGTPALRVNTSGVFNNLWQLEHSLGLQYNFSPEAFKQGSGWNFYDRPLVANYSAFYRMPLSSEQPVEDQIAANPGTFGFDEATRRFRLPPPSGRSELNVFGSRSTIDTGVLTLSDRNIQNIPGALSISERDVQEDLTRNVDLGARISMPLPSTEKFRSSVSWGLDYKEYSLNSSKTNYFFFDFITVNPNGTTNPPVRSVNISAVPPTLLGLNYLPLMARYDGALKDEFGTTSFGLGVSGNSFTSGDLRTITGSTNSSSHWFVLTPSLSREFVFHTNWVFLVRADGQWASESLISNEQFGAGGINSVRGYREGEVFGDEGWKVSIEQKTPPHLIGALNSRLPLSIRANMYMDYAEIYLLDPRGRKDHVSLWGVGIGTVISLGTYWESRFLFSLPLERTATTTPYQPRFDFMLTSQF